MDGGHLNAAAVGDSSRISAQLADVAGWVRM
jgi:hypothetical protein